MGVLYQHRVKFLLFNFATYVVILSQIHFSSAKSIQNSSQSTSSIHQNGTDEVFDFCTSQACIYEAEKMKSYMNESVDPCDDFYAFACGGFIQQTKIPKDQVEVTQFSLLDDKVATELKLLLEEPISPSELKPFSLAKTLYKSCMDVERLENLGLSPLLKVLEGMGGWPVLLGNEWKPHENNWTTYLIWLKETGLSKVDTFLKILEESDFYNVSNTPITIDIPKLSLSYTTLIKGLGSPFVYIYYRYMVDMAAELGAEQDQASAEMFDAIKFELQIANCVDSSSKGEVVETMSIEKMDKQYPNVTWLDFLQKLFPAENLTNEVNIQVYYPLYANCFVSLVNNADQRTIANYVGWRAVASSAQYLNEFSRNLKFERQGMISGLPYRSPRWRECVTTLQENMGESMGAMYVRHFYNESYKTPFLEIVHDLQDTFQSTLNDADWIDLETKKKAKEKALLMQINLGYPDLYKNETGLSSLYSRFHLKDGKFYENILSLISGFNSPELASIRDSISRSNNFFGWESTASNLRAKNSIQVPVALLQTPYFNATRPQYLNYATIGSSVAHEIIHGFDSKGRYLDEFGNFDSWWGSLTKFNFDLRKQCMIDQYNAFHPNIKGVNLSVNGENTLAENIADNWGYKGAYRAYQNWVQRYGKSEQSLKNLNYKPNQLFWIAAAQKWCSVQRSDYLEFLLAKDEHTPSEYRVKGVFSNSYDFARDFHCLPAQKMNPNKKCAIW